MFRRPFVPLLVALGCAFATAVVWLVAFRTVAGARLDSAVQAGFTGLQGSRLGALGADAAHLADPLPFALLALAIVAVALARRRVDHAIVVAVVLLAANVTTQLLKHVTEARPTETVASWPSGHTTAAMTIALCLVVVVPARLRPLAAALGGAYAVAVAYGVLVAGWHLPSDVLGAFGVATTALALTIAAVHIAAGRREARGPSGPRLVAPAAVLALTGGALAAGVAVLRPARALAYAQDHTAFVAAAVALGAAGLALAVATAAALAWVERGPARQ